MTILQYLERVSQEIVGFGPQINTTKFGCPEINDTRLK